MLYNIQSNRSACDELPSILVNSRLQITSCSLKCAEIFGNTLVGVTVTVRPLGKVTDKRFPYTAVTSICGKCCISCVSPAGDFDLIYIYHSEFDDIQGALLAIYAVEMQKCSLSSANSSRPNNDNVCAYANSIYLLSTCLNSFYNENQLMLTSEDMCRLVEYTVKKYKAAHAAYADKKFKFHCFCTADLFKLDVSIFTVCMIIAVLSFANGGITHLIDRTLNGFSFRFEFESAACAFDYKSCGYAGWMIEYAIKNNGWLCKQENGEDNTISVTFTVPCDREKFTLHQQTDRELLNELVCRCVNAFMPDGEITL